MRILEHYATFQSIENPLPFQKSLKRCGLCHGPLVEILESREVSYYVNAEFHSIEEKKLKNSITIQVREPLLHELALGQTFEMVIKARNEDLECISLEPFDDHLSKFIGMDTEMTQELKSLYMGSRY